MVYIVLGQTGVFLRVDKNSVDLAVVLWRFGGVLHEYGVHL